MADHGGQGVPIELLHRLTHAMHTNDEEKKRELLPMAFGMTLEEFEVDHRRRNEEVSHVCIVGHVHRKPERL